MGIVRLHPTSGGPAAPAAASVTSTLAEHAAQVDARRYVEPAELDRRLDLLLDPAGPTRVLTVTGRGGVGKSAALRAAGRRARAEGWQVVALDARSDDVLAALDAVERSDTVVVVDEVEALGPALAALATAVAHLPDGTRVVMAARALPARWLPEPLSALGVSLRLSGLAPDEADALLVRYGVDDPVARGTIAQRAAGLPLALVLGARAWAVAEDDDTLQARSSGEELIAHLADTALDRLGPDLLAVLVLTAGVDAALLADLFPGRSAELLAALRETSLVESMGDRVVLHPALAECLADRMRVDEPHRVATAVLRIAAHEHARAVAGDGGALSRLAGLVRDPGLRGGLGPAALTRYHADRWRAGDLIVVRDALERDHPGVWPLVAPWLEGHARVVRRSDGRAVAVVAAMDLAAAGTTQGHRERLIAPVLAHARAAGAGVGAVLTAFQITFADVDEAEVAWVRNAAGLAQAAVGNPRSDRVNLLGEQTAHGSAERAVLEAYGYAEVVGLRRSLDGVAVSTWLADVGVGGLAGLLHAAVVGEQGGPGVVPDGGAGVDLDGFWGLSDREQARLRVRIDEMLAGEPELHDLVVRRYLTAGATHESVLRATYLSRATYFRRLRRARDLLAR